MTKARGDLPDPPADLSEAARAVVRDAGDPRTDAYLAALGLVDAPAPKTEAGSSDAPSMPPAAEVGAAAKGPAQAEQLALPVAPAEHPELAPLRERVAALEADLEAAASRARVLTVALAIAAVAAVVLLALLLVRPA